MTRQCRQMLYFLIDNSDDDIETVFELASSGNVMDIIDKQGEHSVKFPDFIKSPYSELIYLNSTKHIVFTEESENTAFTLTYDGLHYRHFIIEKIFDFLSKSVFTPIGLSFVTALITAHLAH